MKTLTITHTLQQAEHINEFRSARGKRLIGLPYWRQLEDGTLWFEYISELTDVKLLLEQIKKGEIYVRHCVKDKDGRRHYSGVVS